jgi:O-antigen biosynthesis protein
MPRFSLLTPLHDKSSPFVAETYQSLQRQSDTDWQWIVLVNNGGVLPEECRADARVKVVEAVVPEGLGIGWLKRTAAEHADGHYLVELDADDLLDDEALAHIGRAFETGADFVYSDFAEFHDGTWAPNWYNRAFGWQQYGVLRDGHPLVAMRAPPATAQNMRRIEWAPNHVRAWRASSYREVGGHDPQLVVADDHDLVLRCHLAGHVFEHVPRCLYFYRVHKRQTTKEQNARIQAADALVYDRYVAQLAEHWAKRTGLRCVDLCGGINPRAGYDVLDALGRDDWADLGSLEENLRGEQPLNLRCDLNGRWPLPDNSVGVLRASDALEHLRDPVHVMNEAYRVLAPGGFFLTHTPSTDGRGAFCDPTHVSFWNQLSFRYYTDPNYARFIPRFAGRFQLSRPVRTFFPDAWHEEQRLPYVEAHLLALKPGYAPMGPVLWR